jgi:hypothetical protein
LSGPTKRVNQRPILFTHQIRSEERDHGVVQQIAHKGQMTMRRRDDQRTAVEGLTGVKERGREDADISCALSVDALLLQKILDDLRGGVRPCVGEEGDLSVAP